MKLFFAKKKQLRSPDENYCTSCGKFADRWNMLKENFLEFQKMCVKLKPTGKDDSRVSEILVFFSSLSWKSVEYDIPNNRSLYLFINS